MTETLTESLLARRIRARLPVIGKSAARASLDAGFGKDFIADIFKGKKDSIYGDNLAALARELQVPAAYLTDDDFVLENAPLTIRDSRVEGDIVKVPQIDLRFGMGGGQPFDEAVTEDVMDFPKNWIRQFTTSSLTQLFFVIGAGDSMSPTIGDSDILLCDRTQTQPSMGDKIWAITQYGHGQIKRLRPTQNGYQILSDNPLIPPDMAADGSMEIIGRVIAIVRRV
ncbi:MULTISPECIES: S24 family peptidase [Asticcacaulis]|uniref:S24 family peptidase n=1 Tax=Asticcacaulis TaxID=76890 RepID=UPI001AE667B2|nr:MULTISPECIES: S24 family peptidase [Asticcacaulis]MBP2161290.1 phage repressor protein C with HTH and peptisase S24 domain [Asticcacaulis solisilvae]MDR6802344.1 phage repressor protein C with HTH and peptisase S24 domain [Asticcacaulis sp. BE141]